MTKKTLEEHIDKNWISAFTDNDPHYVIEWLKENVPEGYFLDTENYYDYLCGRLTKTRQETDEEYAQRLHIEQVSKDERETARIREAIHLQSKVALLKSTDIALTAYLEKHKGNPNIGDMENLFTALAQIQMSGNSNTQVVRQLKECLDRLENT